jgi:hypothetical protein
MAINSTIGKLMKDIQEDIQDINLTGLVDANVIILPIPMDDEYKLVPSLPAVIVCPFGTEQIGNLTNLSDKLSYPILVAIMVKSATIEDAVDPVDEMDKYLVWREEIIDIFIHDRSTTNLTAADVIDKTLELSPIVNLQSYLTQSLFISSMIVRCHTDKTRRT